MNDTILSLMTFAPLIGVLLLFFIPKDSHSTLRGVAFAVALVTFLISLPLVTGFVTNAEYQFETNLPWIAAGPFQMNYHVGIDGISLWLVILTTFIMPLAVLSTWTAVEEKVKEYMICLLLLEVAMLGAFVSLDLFLFYIFWELMLIPMYFIIGIWGGKQKIYAALKFFIYTMVGSVLMLVALIVLYFLGTKAGLETFDISTLHALSIAPAIQTWLFLAFALSFAIKVPLFPVHTWLPLAHTEAPTAGSVILAAILLKMGTYGYVRFAIPLFPQASERFTPLMATLAVIGIIYAALVAMVQEDVKKLVAYSSVAHLGFVMLGIFALNQQGLSGGMLQMLNHGVSTGALFLIVGFIYERRHTRLITDFGGLSKQMPVFATIFMIVTFSSIGLPGTNGFVGEFLVLLGSFGRYPVLVGIATTVVVFSAAYMLWSTQRVFFNRMTNPKNEGIGDLSLREIAVLAPLLVGMVWIGLFPGPILRRTEGAARTYIEMIQPHLPPAREVAAPTASVAPTVGIHP